MSYQRKGLLFVIAAHWGSIDGAIPPSKLKEEQDRQHREFLEHYEEFMRQQEDGEAEQEEDAIPYDPENEDPLQACRRDPTWKSTYDECQEVTGRY